MCIVIDINVLGSVFSTESVNHKEFKPVNDWILDGKGMVVFGGRDFVGELAKSKYLKFFQLLKDIGKAIRVADKEVDDKLNEISLIINDDCNDPHIVALLIVSGCKLICSEDKKAYPYFRSSEFFKPSSNKPKIYRGSSNKNLLNDRNIGSVCLKCKPTTNIQREAIKSFKSTK